MDREIETLSDQISLTDSQKVEIGLQETDLADVDTIAETLRAARETLLGEQLDVGEKRIGLGQDKHTVR